MVAYASPMGGAGEPASWGERLTPHSSQDGRMHQSSVQRWSSSRVAFRIQDLDIPGGALFRTTTVGSSTRLPNQDIEVTILKMEVFLGFMGDITTKMATNLNVRGI